ncbi:MAG: PucR family transcriptional regulator [Lentihominibacter sp.]|jgi:sugar diacid utilization regulator
MKVTVANCLELEAFTDAEIIAGKKGLKNEIKTISVLDVCGASDMDLIETARTGLLLTSFTDVRDDVDGQCRIVKEIAERGCAGLVVCNIGRVVKELDDKVISTANNTGLPLIKMAPGTGYSAVISQVMDRVLYGDNFANSLISNTIFHLLDFEKHSNFQSAAREAAINNDFQLVILSEDFNPIFTVETRHEVNLADAIRLGREKNVEQDTGKFYTLINIEGALTYWGPVIIGNEKYYMFIVDNEDSYTAGEITKLAEIIELAMGMWKYTPERDAKAEFIKALIRGNRSLAYSLQEEAKIDGSDVISAFFIKGLDRDAETQFFADFEKKTDLEIWKIAEEEDTYGIILNTEEGSSRIEQQTDCVVLFNKMKVHKSARIFHVTGLNGIEGIGDAYKLIGETWNFVQSVFPYKRLFTKYELTLASNCINVQIQGGFVKKSYMELLEPFKEAGENKGRQLLDTLETFVLDAGMNSSKTAEFMDVHTNTIQYRLKKINEMLGVEITGNRVIPGLTVALALKRLERAVS